MRTSPTRTISGRVTGAGALQACSDPRVSVNRVSAGVYDLAFPADFRLFGLTATSWEGFPILNSFDQIKNPVRVYALNNAGTAVDRGWTFVAVGAA